MKTALKTLIALLLVADLTSVGYAFSGLYDVAASTPERPFARWLFTTVRDDPDQAQAEAADFLGGTYRQDFKAMIDHVAAAGTVPQVAARVQAYVDAGARHIVFAVAAKEDRLAMARRIVAEVIPRVTAPAD